MRIFRKAVLLASVATTTVVVATFATAKYLIKDPNLATLYCAIVGAFFGFLLGKIWYCVWELRGW